MRSLTYKFGRIVVLSIIVISIPASIIYYDYSNDPIMENSGSVIGYSVTLNQTGDQISILVGDLPSLTMVGVYLNFTDTNFNGTLFAYIIEEPIYPRFLEGDYPLNELPSAEIDGDFISRWLNTSLVSDGNTRIVFTLAEGDGPVTIEGYYTYEAESYLIRNIFALVSYNALYLLIVIGFIPPAIKRYRVNKMKRQKAEELIAEEEAFYRKLEQEGKL